MGDFRRDGRTVTDVLGLIGGTPMVRIALRGQGARPRILAKAEFTNPTGSHKDRIYLRMIAAAEKRGELRPGMTILEGSTGNAGAACAMLGRLKGYPVVVVMPEGMSEERKKTIGALGGKLVFTPGGESDQDLSLRTIERMMAAEPGKYWYPGQFHNPDNPLAHYETTGPEIWEQCEGRIDVFVAAVGSGGVLTGVGRYLKERNPQVKLFAVEPTECAILSRGEWGSHEIQGIGDGFVPRNLDLSLLDGVATVSSGEAIEMARRLCAEQGLLVGISSGCNVAAVFKTVNRHPGAGTVVTVLCDTAFKYFSSPLFGVKKDVQVPRREHVLDPESRRQLDRYAPAWEIIN